MTQHALTETIPPYLQTYIVRQDPTLYTAIDHAGWRFILKISGAFFATHAHQKYQDGLRETGISPERIPLIEEMDQKLRKFHWRAVAVSGFIPPAVFMEFLALGILPIACDMRQLEHLAYTPSPDIVHEAAGHAPIIADPEYAAYLRHYGEIAKKVIFSSQDLDVYHAIRNLSDTKENPRSTPQQIQEAQDQLDRASAAVDYVTEATQLSRMSWWTIEYGLIGNASAPKIYGAGLLSSVGESYHCLGPKVRKIPFSLDCINQTYDITKPQPQLYVAEDFKQITRVLDEFAKTCAFRIGGIEGLEKARKAATTTTAEFDSGLQMSGTLVRYLKDQAGNACYLQYQGPTQLAFQDQELPDQGPSYHQQGFGTPVGGLKSTRKSPAELNSTELAQLGFNDGKKGRMEFESGVVVEGVLQNTVQRNGKNLILVFKDCKVTLGDQVLFDPSWGTFDMGCGARVVSVYGHAADRAKYLQATGGFHQPPGHPKTNLTASNKELNELYRRVRELRESKDWQGSQESVAKISRELDLIEKKIDAVAPKDWLLRYELLELNKKHQLAAAWEKPLLQRLKEVSAESTETKEVIDRGLAIL